MERSIYNDIPTGKFHSALLTTFSLNLHHFEGNVLRILREKRIFSVNIFVDHEMLDDSFNTGLTTNNIKELGKSYSVNAIEALGAFHPKINLFIGDNSLLAIFGSGNISAGGHGKNHEMFTGFMADGDNSTQMPLLVELWRYVVGYASQSCGYFKERVSELGQHCELLKGVVTATKHKFHTIDSQFEAALLYNDNESSIFNQLISLISFAQVQEMSIISPYYDKNGDLANELSALSPNSKVNLYMQAEGGIYPDPNKLRDNINIYNFDSTNRGLNCNTRGEYNKFLHAKIFHFKTLDCEYCLIGSANASVAAFGLQGKNAANDELCVLYKSSNYNFLKEFGITKKEALNITGIESANHNHASENRSSKRLKLISADHLHNSLLLYINVEKCKNLNDKFNAQIYGSSGDLLVTTERFKVGEKIIVEQPNETLKSAQYVVIVDIDEQPISNRQPINHLTELANTDPERVARDWRAALNEININGSDVLKIVKVLFDINACTTSSSRNKASSISPRQQETTPKSTYDEAVAKMKMQHSIEDAICNNKSVKIWDNITQYLKSRMQQLLDAAMDEEEVGEASRSSEVTQHFDKGKEPTKANISNVNKITSRLLKWYLAECKNSKGELSSINYGQLSLALYLTTLVCFQSKYDQKYADIYTQTIMEILTHYAKLLRRREQMEYDSELAHLELKHNAYWSDATKHFLLCASVIRTLSNEPVVAEAVNILCYNILQNSPQKARGMKEFIANTITGCNLCLNSLQITRMFDTIISDAATEKYQYIDNRGVCAIKDKSDKNSSRVTSIYGGGLTIVENKKLSAFDIMEYM